MNQMNHYIISKDSILYSLPTKKTESRHLIYFDAIVHIIDMVDIMYCRLVDLFGIDADPPSTNVDVFLKNRREFFPGFCRLPLEIVLCSSLAYFLIFYPGYAGHLSSSSSGADRSLPSAVPSF